MATVLTRLLPTTSSRLLTRQLRKDVEVANRNAHTANSIIAVTAEPKEDESDASGSPEEDMVVDAQETIDGVDDESDYISATEIRAPPSGSRRRSVKRDLRRGPQSGRKSRRIATEEASGEDQDEDEQADDSGSSESSDHTSTADDAWEGESDAAEEQEIEVPSANQCIFCGEDEEHDPGEDFEEILSCSVCGDNAHRQCARDEDALASENAQKWHCPSCIQNDLQSSDEQHSPPRRRRSSVPKMSRDLLPASKPGAHSVFSTLILDDDPQDGSRALRKRRISSDSQSERQSNEPRKRQRSSASAMEAVKLEERAVEPKRESPNTPEVVGGQEDARHPRRTRAPRPSEQHLCRTVIHDEDRLILAMMLGTPKLQELEHELKKKRRRERDRARRARQAEIAETVTEVVLPHYPTIQTSSAIAPFYGFHDREGEESKTKPYGGILSEADADTSRTFPQVADRKKFEDARQKAEEEWKKKIEASSINGVPRPSQKVSGPPSKIKCISFGKYEIDTWHAAPYPEEYSRNRALYICEFCLKYMSSDYVAWRHKLKCPTKHPPGDEIYREGNFSFFEVDGRKNPVYCQNLCLLAKLFLGSKTLYYDVEPFLFYVMTEHDQFGEHFVGYFSKEKRPSSLNNVSCILVLPIHQRRGFGHMLIEFSYLLTKVERKTGSPEKPLSDMGLVSYRSYWRLLLCRELLGQKTSLSITGLSERTGMTPDDVVSALEGLRALVRDPVTRTYALRLDYTYFQQYIDNYEKKGYPRIEPEALCWVPYVMGRDNMHYEGIPHIHTVAQRDDTGADEAPEEGVQLEVQAESFDDAASQEQQCEGLTESVAVEKVDSQSQEQPTTPFPSFNSDNKHATPLQPMDPNTSSTELPKSFTTTIPPSRFEVFPPLPGTAAKRRPGRPFGRRGSRRGTPGRLAASPGRASMEYSHTPHGTSPATIKRTRSRLAEGMIHDESDAENAQGAESVPANREDNKVEHPAEVESAYAAGDSPSEDVDMDDG